MASNPKITSLSDAIENLNPHSVSAQSQPNPSNSSSLTSKKHSISPDPHESSHLTHEMKGHNPGPG